MPKHKSIKKEEKGDKKGTKKAYLMAIMESTFNITNSSTWDGLLGIFLITISIRWMNCFKMKVIIGYLMHNKFSSFFFFKKINWVDENNWHWLLALIDSTTIKKCSLNGLDHLSLLLGLHHLSIYHICDSMTMFIE
jgi:hypothetical protein